MLHYNLSQQRRLQSPADLDAMLAAAAAAAQSAVTIVAVQFGADFDVRDSHVTRLVDALGPQLQSIYLGSSDTGCGTWLTDAAVHAIVRGCPSLRQLALCSCTNVTDKAFLAVVEGLQQLEVLHCTGHDRTSGKLTKKAVQPLIKDPTALSRLRELYITDQGIDYGAVQRLLKARRQLKVQAGETDSDSYAWSCVLRASGRTYGDGLYGRW